MARTQKAPQIGAKPFLFAMMICAIVVVILIAHTLKSKTPPVGQSQTTKPAKIDYDFYTMLPQMSTDPAQAKVVEDTARASVKHTATTMLSPYFLQIASLSNREAADRLAKQMQNQGYSTDIQVLDGQDQSWFRVLVGPFDTEIGRAHV